MPPTTWFTTSIVSRFTVQVRSRTNVSAACWNLTVLPVTIASGSPRVDVEVGAGALNPYGFGTGFGTSCDAFFFGNTYVIGDPADPCGNTNGIAGDWFDFVPALPPAAANSPPVLI